MAKKSDDEKDMIDEEANSLLNDVNHDRQRVSDFLDTLLGFDDPHMAAEAIARIADSLTRQNMLRINALKAKIKRSSGKTEDSADDVFDSIGSPFHREDEAEN